MKGRYLFFAFWLFLAVAVSSCGPKEPEKDPEPTILTINPTSRTSESGFAHDLVFKVVCDGEFEASLTDGTWATITDRKEGNGGAINLIVHLTDNYDEKSRSETLTVTAGNLTQKAVFTQLSLGIVFPDEMAVLYNLTPVDRVWKFPSVWSAKCCNADGTDADWFTLSQLTGDANTEVNVSIRANHLNLTEADYVGYIVINLGSLTLTSGVTLKPIEYGNDSFGVFNYDKADSSLEYIPLKNQYSRIRGGNGVFRIIDLVDGRFLIIRGLPDYMNEEDNITLEVYQTMTEDLPYKSQYPVRVFRSKSGKVWMVTKDDVCFVVPQ